MRGQDVYAALERLQADLPVPVQHWDVESGPDATDDEAVWVWATLRDEDLTDGNRTMIQARVREAVRALAGDHPPWVYVRFRGQSERIAAG